MATKKRGNLKRLLIKHGLYRADKKGNPIGLSRKGAYTLIFIVLSIGGSFGFLAWMLLEGRLQAHPTRYIMSVAAALVFFGVLAAADYKLHPEGD